MLKRRSFLASILAAGVAPAAVGSGILMPIKKIAMPSDVLTLEMIDRAAAILHRNAHPLFLGEWGEWHGMRIITTPPPHIIRTVTADLKDIIPKGKWPC